MDKVVEDIQSQFTIPPYITITHAYVSSLPHRKAILFWKQ
jgi:hypothetical protein